MSVPRNVRRFVADLRLAVSSRRDGAGRPAGRRYTNRASGWTTICSWVPAALFDAIVPLLHIEPLERAFAHIGRRRVLGHQALVAAP